MMDQFSLHVPTKLKLADFIEKPKDMDVLCGYGVGTLAANHPGNQLLQMTIERFMQEYSEAKAKQAKVRINKRILNIMQNEHGSRFVGKDKSGRWYHMQASAIRDKITGALRYGLQKKGSAGAPPTTTLTSPRTFTNVEVEFCFEPLAVQDLGDDKSIQDSLVALYRQESQILDNFLIEDDSDHEPIQENLLALYREDSRIIDIFRGNEIDDDEPIQGHQPSLILDREESQVLLERVHTL